jgi:hypothetical protein
MSVPIPIRGPLAVPLRIFGVTQSKMNPNICTICERAFRRVKKHRHVSATVTILFADIRGYTRLSERMDPVKLSEVVSIFQDQCAQAIWAHDGIVNKQMGDGLMAIFNFPIKIERHAEAAMTAAIEIQQRCKTALAVMEPGDEQPGDRAPAGCQRESQAQVPSVGTIILQVELRLAQVLMAPTPARLHACTPLAARPLSTPLKPMGSGDPTRNRPLKDECHD